jgi:hypothetical protein
MPLPLLSSFPTSALRKFQGTVTGFVPYFVVTRWGPAPHSCSPLSCGQSGVLACQCSYSGTNISWWRNLIFEVWRMRYGDRKECQKTRVLGERMNFAGRIYQKIWEFVCMIHAVVNNCNTWNGLFLILLLLLILQHCKFGVVNFTCFGILMFNISATALKATQ